MSQRAALAVHDTGSGDALLMLHAFPLEASQWDHQVAALSGTHRCVRPDLWGCGSSPQVASTPDLGDFAAAVLAWLDAAGIDQFTVIGSSMGGYIAFELWRRAPARLQRMVMCATRAAADTDERREDRLQQVARVIADGDVEAFVPRYAAMLVAEANQDEVHLTDPLRGRIRRCTVEGFTYGLQAMASRPDHTDLLASIDVPALVVVGLGDRVIPPDESRRMAAAMPQARLHEMAGCGHLPNLEDPAGFTAVVEEFLRG